MTRGGWRGEIFDDRTYVKALLTHSSQTVSAACSLQHQEGEPLNKNS